MKHQIFLRTIFFLAISHTFLCFASVRSRKPTTAPAATSRAQPKPSTVPVPTNPATTRTSASQRQALQTTTPIAATSPEEPEDDPFSDNVAADTATPSAGTEPGITMDLPIIGTVNLIPFTEDGKSGFKVYLPAQGKKINWGPLIVGDGQLRLIDDKPQYLAHATLFGKAATLGIKDFTLGTGSTDKKKTYSKITFGITFDKDAVPSIELIPGKKADLPAVDLILEKTKPILLVGSSTILGQPAQVTLSIAQEGTNGWAEFKNVPLKEVISQVQGTPLEKAMLTTFKATVKNVSSSTAKARELTIEGKADLSQTPGLEQSPDAKEVTFNATASTQQQTFNATAKQLVIPQLGTIADAKIIGNFTDAKKEVTLNGSSTLNFPGVGSFDTKIHALLNNDGIELKSKINQAVSFGGINIKNVELVFSSAQKTLSLIGQGTVKGYVADVELTKDIKDAITMKAALKQKEIKPFDKINMPILSDLILKDPSFSFVKKENDYETIMHGTVTLFGVPLASDLFVKKGAGNQTVTLLQVAAPKNWKLADGIANSKELAALDNTIFENIELKDLIFIFTSDNYVDTDRKMTFKKGFNFISTTKLTGPLVPVSTFTKTPQESVINLQGYLDTAEPLNSVFIASIPNGVVIKQTNGAPRNDVTLSNLQLEIAGNPVPAFSLLTTLQIKPSINDDLLTLTGRIMFRPPAANLAATMQGTWKNALGISGLNIGNVAAEIAFGVVFPETGVPDSIGMAGELGLGKRNAAMALKMPIAGPADVVLCGALDALTITDLADAAAQIAGKKLNFEKLPEDIGVKNIKTYAVPKTATIGELTFQKGFTLRGVIFVPGFKAMGNITLSSSGLISQASCTEIKYGPLLITRAAADKSVSEKEQKASTDSGTAEPPMEAKCKPDSAMLSEYNGATMRIVLNVDQSLDKQGVLVSGLFKLADIFEQESFLLMDNTGIQFNLETAIGKTMYNGKPLLLSKIAGKSSGSLGQPQFAISIDFLDNFQAYLLSQVKDGIKTAQLKVTEGVAKAIGDVQASKALNPTEVGKKVDEAQKQVQAQRKIVQQLQNDIDELQRKINQCV
jgi:hypothetical protein